MQSMTLGSNGGARQTKPQPNRLLHSLRLTWKLPEGLCKWNRNFQSPGASRSAWGLKSRHWRKSFGAFAEPFVVSLRATPTTERLLACVLALVQPRPEPKKSRSTAPQECGTGAQAASMGVWGGDMKPDQARIISEKKVSVNFIQALVSTDI